MVRVLVTGASGFIGSRLVKKLRERGREYEVTEMVRYQSGGRFNYYDQVQRVFVDIRDAKEVYDAVLKAKPEVIIHLAAMSAVAYSFDHSEEVNDVNYMGTVRVANAAREVGAWLIMAGTSEVYGRGDHVYPLTEAERYGGTSPYAASKIAAIEYLKVQESVHHLPVTIMVPFNTIGRALVPPGGNRHFVVERAITQAIETGSIELHDPRPVRDFMFRDDHVEAYIRVVQNRDKAVGETFNICTGDAISIETMAYKVADLVSEKTGKAVSVAFTQVPDRPLDIATLHGSNKKALGVLGWMPLYTIGQALERAVEEWTGILKATSGPA